MIRDLFPVAMIFFRSVASLMLEPLMNVCWRQIFAILFCLKRNNWRLSKAITSWFDIVGYFTIFSSIQTYRIQLYTKNIQSNCCSEEGFNSFCGGGGGWYDLWLFLKAVGSNFEFHSTKDRPNFLKCVFVKINGSDVNNKIAHWKFHRLSKKHIQ